MQLEIASSDDLAALYGTYIELVDADREAQLDIHVAPGVYGVASIGPVQLDLGGNPAPAEPKIDIVLRGDPTAPPVVFRDLGMRVTARSLRLENLILTGRRQNVLEARVSDAFVMKRCVVAGHSWDGPWGGALLRVTGLANQPAYTVGLEDAWFIQNGEQSEAALLEVSPATGSYVEQVALRGVHFLGNTTHSDLLVHEARAIRGEALIVVKDHRGGAVFLRHERCGRPVIEHSTFLVTEPAAIAFEDTRHWSAGLELARSKVHVSGTSRTLPPGVRGSFEVLAAPPRVPGALDTVLAAITDGIPDPSTTRELLRHALGL